MTEEDIIFLLFYTSDPFNLEIYMILHQGTYLRTVSLILFYVLFDDVLAGGCSDYKENGL